MPKDPGVRAVALVKATVPALEAHGLAITRRMYERMFRNEAIRDLSNQSHHGETGSQPKALARATVVYARNIEGLISIEWLGRNTPMQGRGCFLRGPCAFLRNSAGGPARAGVASDRIQYDFFDAADESLAA